MKYCKKCSLHVNTDSEKCPLCSSILTMGDSDASIINTGENLQVKNSGDCSKYPKLEGVMEYKYNFVFRLFLLLSIATGSTCLLVNILTYSGILWSFIVAGAILLLWAVIVYPLFVRKNIGHIIIVDVISISIFLYIIQVVTRTKGWALDYVVPFLFVGATLMITFIIFIKRMRWREYSIYQTTMMIIGFLPVVFCISGLVSVIWPSIVSVFYSFMTFAGMFIFADKKYENELIKRFHL